MNFDDKIKELKIELPEAKAPVGSYVATKIVGKLLYVSGQISIDEKGVLIKGKVGRDLNTDEAYKAAERCGLSIVAQVKKACNGDLSKVKSCIKLTGFVNSTEDYIEQPKVINGASDLVASIFGEAGMVERSPESVKKYLSADQQKLYNLIWGRALASQMETAKFDRSTITISSKDENTICKSSGSVLKFDGYLKVFPSPSKDDDETLLPEMSKGPINIESLLDEQHFTQPPPRYSEASLVKKLEELGIGRPSTYASIISTIANRGYAEILNKRFFPTDRGKLISAFLEKLFSKYVDYNFTASLEDQLDEITTGKESWIRVLELFWKDFNNNVSEVKEKRTREVLDLLNDSLGALIFDKDTDGKVVRKCQLCNDGSLSLKNSFRGGAFIGCSNYPECKFTRPLSKAKAAAQAQLAEPKFIGKHENGNDIYLKNGRFGPYLQYEKILEEIPEEKTTKKKKKKKKLKSDVNELLKNVSIPKGLELESIDLEKAQFLCSLPKSLGINPENQKDITLNTGRFGPYLKCDNKSARIENIEEIFSIGLNRAITMIAEAKPGRMSSSIIKDLGEHPEDKKPVRVMKGQYGPYIKYKSLNATIPEEKDPTELTMEEALILIEKRKEYDKTKKKKKKKKGK